jgi:hypothetical protein
MEESHECGWGLVLGGLQFSNYALASDSRFGLADIYLYGRLLRV